VVHVFQPIEVVTVAQDVEHIAGLEYDYDYIDAACASWAMIWGPSIFQMVKCL